MQQIRSLRAARAADSRLPDLYLLLTAVLFGLNFIVVKAALTELRPLTFAVIRILFAAGVLVILAGRQGRLVVERRDVPKIVVVALLGITLNQALVITALANTTAVNASLLVAGTIPVFTAAFGALLGTDRIGLYGLLGLALGGIGLGMVVLGGSQAVSGQRSLFGDLLALAAAATWAANTVLLRPLIHRYGAIHLALLVLGIGWIMLLPFALQDLRLQNTAISLNALAALAYSGGLALAATHVLQFSAIRQVGAARAALFSYLTPFLGVAFAVVLLAEAVTAVQLVGGAILAAGVWLGRQGTSLGPRMVPAGTL